ncbi:MAG: uroporphyrinogen-III synthase [Saprospiraceae bacterium]|nr:uroporphyrinogen-III synthase [Saprospiraceae bacterium]MDZ4706117.1 uroporphyrinogen-III synthase [Saprospiraceae bacterium]
MYNSITAQKIFISRPAPPESVFRRLLEPQGFEVEGRSLVAFSALPFVLPASFDWVFFYSSHGVRFFFEQLAKTGITLPQTTHFGAIGPATARLLETVHFVGDGTPEKTTEVFRTVAAGKRVLFPRAAHSRQSVQLLLGNTVEALDLVVYQNEPLREVVLSDAAALIFTSPLNAQAYFSKHRLLSGQKVFAIGQTTAQALSDLRIVPEAVAPQPSEEALAGLVLTLLKGTE